MAKKTWYSVSIVEMRGTSARSYGRRWVGQGKTVETALEKARSAHLEETARRELEEAGYAGSVE